MKITDVRPWIVGIPYNLNPGAAAPSQRAFIFVAIDTDAGVTGWGEITTLRGR